MFSQISFEVNKSYCILCRPQHFLMIHHKVHVRPITLNKSCRPNQKHPIKCMANAAHEISFNVHQHHHPQNHAQTNWSASAQCRTRELFSCLSHIKHLAISFCSSSHSPKQEQIVSFSFRVGCHQDRPLPAGKE